MKSFKRRVFSLIAIVLALFTVLMVSLFTHTIVYGDELLETGLLSMMREIKLMARRGQITDVNGQPLAYDRESYNIQFYRDPLRTGEKWRALYTEIIIKTIDIIEKNGNKVIDVFAIRRYKPEEIDQEKAEKGIKAGDFYFYWGVTNENVAAARHKLWCGNLYISEKATAFEAYTALRQRYMIPESFTFEEAAKVLSVWQEVQNMAFRSYIPVVIAYDVDISTVAEIEQRKNELEGMSSVQSTIRVYPNASTAAHIIGYMGKENDEADLLAMLELGYSRDDKVGITGVEATMEKFLSAAIGERSGKSVFEVDSRGRIIKELERIAPKPGYNVELTIDLELQKVLEKALENNIKATREEQIKRYNEDLDEYKKKEQDRGGLETRFAQTGAAVVIDCNNGNILALASYPSFDLNWFADGISPEEFEILNDSATSPLFNKAISSIAEPGSVFKMVTGLAGLMEGVITPEWHIDCQGIYTEGIETGRGPKCWVYPYFSQHQGENIVKALKDSCNYYFFNVARMLGIDGINKWSDMFGLTSKTGVELTGEATGHVASPKVLFDNAKEIARQLTYKPYLVKESIKKQLNIYGLILNKVFTDEQLEKAATRIVMLVEPTTEEQQYGPHIRTILREELGINENITYARRWHSEISTMLYEIKWNPTQTVLTGIGQSVTAVSPIAVARYIAAIANGGTVYKASIINKVTDNNGNIIYQNTPTVFNSLGDTKDYLSLIKEGMREVISPEDHGTAAKYFKDFEYRTDMAAKTGTAQVSNINIENTSWFVAFTPFENAEIAIAVYIPNGLSGGLSGQTVRDVIQFYRDRQKLQNEDDLTTPGSLLK